jgi:hypothetical protein
MPEQVKHKHVGHLWHGSRPFTPKQLGYIYMCVCISIYYIKTLKHYQAYSFNKLVQPIGRLQNMVVKHDHQDTPGNHTVP